MAKFKVGDRIQLRHPVDGVGKAGHKGIIVEVNGEDSTDDQPYLCRMNRPFEGHGPNRLQWHVSGADIRKRAAKTK